MRLFEKLFNFGPEEIAQSERRLQARYAVAPDFPLVVAVAGHGWNGTGRAGDLGPGGLGLVLDRGPAVDTGSTVRLGLRLEGFEILANGQLRHSRPRESRGFHCGVSLSFADEAEREAFHQMLVPISVGASLAPVKAAPAKAEPAGLKASVFQGEYASRLTAWSRPGGEWTRFEFEVDGHVIRGDAARAGLELVARPSVRPPDSAAGELRRLFRWTVLNLNEKIPAELRKFLGSLLG